MDRIRWGVLGTGNMIHKAGPAIQRSGNGEWLGVAGRNAENGKLAADKFGVPRAYASYQELLEDPEIDAVYIALLNHLHAEWATRAAEAGKHVLVEKPFALTLEEAVRMQKAAERGGVQMMEAFVWRFHPAHLAVRDMVMDGTIGEAAMMHAHFSFIAKENSTRLVKEWGGGSLYDVGCYPVSWSRFFMMDEPAEAVCEFAFDPRTNVDIRFAASLFYPKGRTAFVSSAFDMPIGSFYSILGTKGRIDVAFEITMQSLSIHVSAGGRNNTWTTDRIEPYVWQMEAFSEAILQKKPVPYGLQDALAQAKVLHALFESDRTKQRVRIL